MSKLVQMTMLIYYIYVYFIHYKISLKVASNRSAKLLFLQSLLFSFDSDFIHPYYIIVKRLQFAINNIPLTQFTTMQENFLKIM